VTEAYRWIESEQAFGAVCANLAGEREFALDTESDGFHHYFDKLCLLQISTRKKNFIIDALAVGSLEPLRPVLEDPGIVKVLHAAEQDLMYFRRDHDLKLSGLFDTYIAAQLLGHARLGLASLLEELFGVKLSKSNQRDDWSRRPLTQQQLAYASADTTRLLPMADILRRQLAAKKRMAWAEEEFQAQEQREWLPEGFDPDDITRVKGWKDLTPRAWAILRELLRFRDQEARRLDRPPFRVTSNAVLLKLATDPPPDTQELLRRKGLPRQRSGRLADAFMAAIRRGQELTEDQLPADPRRRRSGPRAPARDAAFESRVNKLKAWRRRKAARLGLEPGVVISQRDMELLAAHPPGSPGASEVREAVRRWRWREFGEEWETMLAATAGGGRPAPETVSARGGKRTG
jgi:ribonuclease D